MRLKAEVVGARRAVEITREINSRAPRDVAKILGTGSRRLLRNIRKNAPRRSGALVKSAYVRFTIPGREYEGGLDIRYSPFVEIIQRQFPIWRAYKDERRALRRALKRLVRSYDRLIRNFPPSRDATPL